MKNTLLILTVFAVAIASLQAQLIDTPATTPPPVAKLAAESIIDAINGEITHRVAVHKTAWETLWENTREGATPEAIIEKMGTKAKLVFAFSKENLEHIARCAALVGKQPTDFIEAKYLASPRTLVFHDDGSVTLAPQ